MSPQRISGLTFTGYAQSRIFEIQNCIRLKQIKELSDSKKNRKDKCLDKIYPIASYSLHVPKIQ